jgi:hypothetical protein
MTSNPNPNNPIIMAISGLQSTFSNNTKNPILSFITLNPNNLKTQVFQAHQAIVPKHLKFNGLKKVYQEGRAEQQEGHEWETEADQKIWRFSISLLNQMLDQSIWNNMASNIFFICLDSLANTIQKNKLPCLFVTYRGN